MNHSMSNRPITHSWQSRRCTGHVCAIIVALLTGITPHAQTPSPRSLRLLFIGNSLTAWNDLPQIVGALAVADGQPRPLSRAVVRGGFSLEDHWNDGEARRAIADGPWDYVILQQGPSSLLESRRLLVQYARQFAPLITAAGAKPALYMVWPSVERRQDFNGVSTSYRRAATEVDGVILPAGEAWREVLNTHRAVKLYSDDGLHPTAAGSYLAALVIYKGLYKRSLIGLPSLGVPVATARLLQEAALRASP
jgi:hypothetical protein